MAATDPTQSIQHQHHPSAFDLSAAELLQKLSAMPVDHDVPYLTITLDWTIEGSAPGRRDADEVLRSQMKHQDEDAGSDRPSRKELELELDRLIDEAGPRGEQFDSLTADRDRIMNWIQNELDPAAQGVYIVANHHAGVFEATGLGLQIETNITLSPVPRVYKLVRLLEDHPTYAVLQADQSEATLSFITHGVRERSVALESNLYPRRHQQGGWSQKRFQARADERIEAFARDISDEVERVLRTTGVETLILAGNDVMMSTLHNEMSDQMREHVGDTIRMESVVEGNEKIDATIPHAEKHERMTEQIAVERLENNVGEGQWGVAGAADTLRALQIGQVSKLIMLDTFDGIGWADYDMHIYGVGNVPTEHPVGGDVSAIVETDLKDEMVRLAIGSDAVVNIIHSDVPVENDGDFEEIGEGGEDRPVTEAAAKLQELGGVGAIFRYVMDGDADPETV